MASFQKLDQKQVPQVIGLGVACCGLFGYFGFKIIAPTASAASLPAKASTAAATTPASATASSTGAATASGAASAPVVNAPPPTLNMRDPFVQMISSTVSAPASPTPAAPAAPDSASEPPTPAESSGPAAVPPAQLGSLPPMGSVPPMGSSLGSAPAASPPSAAGNVSPLPVALAAPAWTVTGVLEGSSGAVAILREGDVRQFAHPGQMVDADFRVVDVTPNSVVLRHGSQTFTLPLGGMKTAAPPIASAPPSAAGAQSPDTPAPASTPLSAPEAEAPATQNTQQPPAQADTATGELPAPSSTATSL